MTTTSDEELKEQDTRLEREALELLYDLTQLDLPLSAREKALGTALFEFLATRPRRAQ